VKGLSGSRPSWLRGQVLLPILIVLIAVASTIVVVHARSHPPAGHSSGTAIVSAALPVVRCPTSVGANIGLRVKMPSVLHEFIPHGLASTTALYVDQYDAVRMLGPRGWSCVTSIGADGGASLSIYPRASTSPGFFKPLSGRSTATEVTVQSEPACYGCRLGLACAFFATARQLIQKDFPGALASCTRPPGESVTDSTRYLRFFSDSAGVVGHAYPSGGPYEALGVVFFNPKTVSYLVSCTLATSSRSMCRGVLDWFVHYHQPI
jgi:hypothetical protein